jgi:spore coat polysaccharide biosynthesis protein SpsF (cytidylyltransferase family)
MKEPIKLKPTVDRRLTSKEGLTIDTNSDYEFHKDVMEEDENDNKDNYRE